MVVDMLLHNISVHLLIFNFFGFFPIVNSSLQGEEVSQWANSIGKELWTLGQAITRFTELKQKYTFHNAKVGTKNPAELLNEIKRNIEIMVERKVSAIKAIQEKAEEVAEQFEIVKEEYSYYSSRYSPVNDSIPKSFTKYKSIGDNRHMYRSMYLNNDTHFYNLPVNTSHSSVHVPVNIYDRVIKSKDSSSSSGTPHSAASAIQWSETLDKVFTKNYNEDPALSWQYFGSITGIMRHYPAQHWEKKELLSFDCRIRTWFIEAATCTKDVIILIDNSGSMDGLGHHIGAFTAKNILDTFSNNDYVNIMNYTDKTNYLIPCFENMLVQATEENIEIFKEALDRLIPEGKTQLGQALEEAFNLLAIKKKGCDEASGSCNQAIMIITDGVNSNLSEIIMKHNYLNNGSNIPVRLFTYLIGKEVSNIPEIQWISCANRGYYTHVESLEQVTASVLKYISVIARPLVLQGTDHPVSWTHAYADLTYDDANDQTVNEPYRLLTSAAIPCYDTKINKMNDSRTAYLLGVAGTDVPLEEFGKLTVPYKIGVNGYAFIISNNGYMLMHPDLRPMFQGITKDNYNSIDITQVEQHFPVDGEPDGPRDIVNSIMDLREALVFDNNGSRHNIKLKYHYENMTRIFESVYDYYFTRINNTPFTVGIALPHDYGNFSLEVGDEITKNKHTGQDIASFFKGKWKIHPKWIYCKYHYLEGHEYPSPEAELLDFLHKMNKYEFKWETQYETTKKRLNDDDYYCDKDLIQRLIFDAKNTNDIFGERGIFSKRDEIIFQKYKVFLRFVATMSGLTRWDYISDDPEFAKFKTREFGDFHPRAINEKWYKSAVLQHQYDESFVYSVPVRSATNTNDTIVTASFAIFPSDGGKEAPGSVVGFQFSQHALQQNVLYNISNKPSHRCNQSFHCGTCADILDCYIIDSSGYVIVSQNLADTSQFFGKLEGDIMESMLKEGVFKTITVYDYQALCLKQKEKDETSSAALLFTPLEYLQTYINWFVFKILYLLIELNLNDLKKIVTYAKEFQEIVLEETGNNFTEKQNITDNIGKTSNETDTDSGDDDENFDNAKDNYFACETKMDLYVLQQDMFKENFHGEISSSERNYYMKRIPNSNLYFVAINNTLKKNSIVTYDTEPIIYTSQPVFKIEVINSTLLPCQKLNLNNLSRRRLTGCYNEHPFEHEILDCGAGADVLTVNSFLILLIIICTVIRLK